MTNENIYNIFDHLSKLNNVEYRIDDRHTQFIELKTTKGLIIQITIPNGIFEWYVDVFDSKRNKLHSDWTDHYSEPIDVLIKERQNDIEEFINEILKGNLHFEKTSILNKFYENK
jgi:hypothetical protein